MALLIDGMYRVANLPKPKPAAPKPEPARTTSSPVDGSDRKFYAKATEKSGDKKILQDFDAALKAQSQAAPPTPTTTSSSTAPKAHVQPQRAEDPSDQKFYNMAADRENKIIDLENRAASLQRDIDVLGTSGGYATEAMRAELDEVEGELDRYRGSPKTDEDQPPARAGTIGSEALPSISSAVVEPSVERYQRVTVDTSYSGKLLGGAEGTLGVDYLVERLDNGEVLVTRAGVTSVGVEAGAKVGLRLDLGANEYGHFSGAEAKLAAVAAGGQTVRLENADDLATFIAADVAALSPQLDLTRRGAGAAYEMADRLTPAFLDRPAGFGLGLIDSITPGDLRGTRDNAVDLITYDLPAPETIYGETGIAGEATVSVLRPQGNGPTALFDPAVGAGADVAVSHMVGHSTNTNSGEVTHYYRASVEGAAYFERDVADRLFAESGPPIVGERLAEQARIGERLSELGVPEDGDISGNISATYAYTVDAEGQPVSLEITSEYQLNDGDQVIRTRQFALDEDADDAVVALIHAGTADPLSLPGAIEELGGSVTDLGVSEDRYRVESEDYGLEGGIAVADAGLSVTVQSATRVGS